MRTPLLAATAAILAVPAQAQSNAIAGTNAMVYDVTTMSYYGRRGAAYPNGEVAFGIGHSMCNSGSVHIPWVSTSGGLMIDTYPKIAFMLARESNGRMVQISGRSFLKHSKTAFNFQSGPCAPCNTGPTGTFRMGCSDTYGPSFNTNRLNLGPTSEIDPWLGSWNPQGSYFDRGDPEVGGAAAIDSVQSLSTTQTSAFDVVKNRVEVRESELTVGGNFYGQIHLMIKGEPVQNRADNVMSRPASLTWNGSSWSPSMTGAAQHGSVLTQWTGAEVNVAGNGFDDGRFAVAVVVTGPVGGFYHYEFAVHNLDNSRAGAALRIPLCDSAQVQNIGFRDIDDNALNQWTVQQSPGELAFLAPPDNALEWNTLYNFWFDCNVAPIDGAVTVDEARIGAGALDVSVLSKVPMNPDTVWLGDGCGAPIPLLSAQGDVVSPNPAFAMRVQAAPFSGVILFLSPTPASIPAGNGCSVYLDPAQITTYSFALSNFNGDAVFAVPIPVLPPGVVSWQAVEFANNGPLLGSFNASNGIELRIGMTGCP